jgi:hypothetical protein
MANGLLFDIPVSFFIQDVATFLVENDGITNDIALKKAEVILSEDEDDDAICIWEWIAQTEWEEVKDHAVLVTNGHLDMERLWEDSDKMITA